VIVIDASALVKYILCEEGWDRVSNYLKRYRSLYSVDHIVKECSNAIWRHSRLRGLIDRDTALELFRRLIRVIETGVVVVEPEGKYLERALELSLNSGLPIYDALYIAQAERYGELLTSDKQQMRTAGSLGIRVHYIE